MQSVQGFRVTYETLGDNFKRGLVKLFAISFQKTKTFLRINWLQKIMARLCFSRLNHQKIIMVSAPWWSLFHIYFMPNSTGVFWVRALIKQWFQHKWTSNCNVMRWQSPFNAVTLIVLSRIWLWLFCSDSYWFLLFFSRWRMVNLVFRDIRDRPVIIFIIYLPGGGGRRRRRIWG